jgi:hypothetical protein
MASVQATRSVDREEEVERMSKTLMISVPFMIMFLVSYCVFLYQRSTIQNTYYTLSVALLAANITGLLQVLSLRPRPIGRAPDANVAGKEIPLLNNHPSDREFSSKAGEKITLQSQGPTSQSSAKSSLKRTSSAQ